MKFGWAASITAGLLSLAMFLAIIRLLRGPSAADRIIALDLLAVVIVGFISSLSVIYDQPIYLDVATSLTVIAFIGTVAFSRLLLRSRK